MKNVKEHPRDWSNILFLSLSPLVALIGTIVYVQARGIHPADIGIFIAFYLLTGLSITAGYHRCFSHRSYEGKGPLKFLYLIFGAAALQNSAFLWSSSHRAHHKYVDTDRDPYNIRQGIWFAHIGWIFRRYRENDSTLGNIRDLERDPLVAWQHRWYLPIGFLVGFGLPTLVGLLFDRPLGGLLWGGLVRVVVVHHATFLINSAAHVFGKPTYDTGNTSKDSWWLAFLTFGEGFHNFHHAFQADYRNGIRWFHWDPSKWLIWVLSKTGMAYRLNRTPDLAIVRARTVMDVERMEQLLRLISVEQREALYARFESARSSLYEATAGFSRARAYYHKARIAHSRRSRARVRLLRYSMRKKRKQFVQEMDAWRSLLAEAQATA